MRRVTWIIVFLRQTLLRTTDAFHASILFSSPVSLPRHRLRYTPASTFRSLFLNCDLWKLLYSTRRTLTNLAETSCSVQQTGNVSAIRRGTNNRQSCVTVSSASPETDEEEGGGDEEESSDQRGANKRVKRRAPKGNRQRGASVVGGGGGHNVDHEDVTLRSGGMRCDSVQHDSTVAVLAAAASGAGLKINVGLPVREDSADVGSVTRVLLQASVDVTMADGGAGRAKVCGKVGERFSGRGSNIGDGGTAVIPISRVLPVLNSRLGAQTATAEQAEPVWSRSRKATLARKSRLRSVASTKQPAVVASVVS